MRARHLIIGLAAVVLGLAPAAPAQELTLAAGAGAFFPSGWSYHHIYGSSFSAGGDVWFTLKNHLGFAAGLDWSFDEGFASGETERYPLEFRRTTIPLVVFYQLEAGAFAVRLGAGAGLHHYEETWQTVDLDYSGNKAGLRFLMAASVKIIGRLALFCSVTYDSISKEAVDPLSNEIKLGGCLIFGGLAFRIF